MPYAAICELCKQQSETMVNQFRLPKSWNTLTLKLLTTFMTKEIVLCPGCSSKVGIPKEGTPDNDEVLIDCLKNIAAEAARE